MIAALLTAVALTLSTSSTASTTLGHRTASVQLRLDRTFVFGDERPELTLVNTGDVRLVHGVPFKLERRVDGTWRWANRDQAFILPLLELEPGEASKPQPIGLYGPPGARRALPPGTYRVTKAAWPARSYPGGLALRVRAIFRVAPDAG